MAPLFTVARTCRQPKCPYDAQLDKEAARPTHSATRLGRRKRRKTVIINNTDAPRNAHAKRDESHGTHGGARDSPATRDANTEATKERDKPTNRLRGTDERLVAALGRSAQGVVNRALETDIFPVIDVTAISRIKKHTEKETENRVGGRRSRGRNDASPSQGRACWPAATGAASCGKERPRRPA